MILVLSHRGQNNVLVLHLLLCVEGVEVVVVGELSATADVLESKQTNSVHPINWPIEDKEQFSLVKAVFSQRSSNHSKLPH